MDETAGLDSLVRLDTKRKAAGGSTTESALALRTEDAPRFLQRSAAKAAVSRSATADNLVPRQGSHNVEAARLTYAAGKLMGAFNDAVLTVQRRRSGGRQVVQVIHQQVAVGAGGKAVIAGSLKGRSKTGGSVGADLKCARRRYKPDWKHGLKHAQAAPSAGLGAGVRSCPADGHARKRVGRLHGGKGSGPRGEKNGAYRTGRYTAEAKAERRQVRMLIRGVRHLIDSSK
jgi:hypothetical protein